MSYASRVAQLVQSLKDLNVLKKEYMFSYVSYPFCDGSESFIITFDFNPDKNDAKKLDFEYDRLTILTAFKAEFKSDLIEISDNDELELCVFKYASSKA